MGIETAGCDNAIYPPMSDQLAAADVTVTRASSRHSSSRRRSRGHRQRPAPRGHAAVEYVLDGPVPYVSGAEWLGTEVLRGRWTLAAAGTHGKTTTASMLAHILHAPDSTQAS